MDDRRVHSGELAHDAFDSARAAPPEPDRRLYREGVKRGGALLTVNVDDQYADEALRIIEEADPIDLDQREAEYRQAGYLSDAAPATGAAMAATSATQVDRTDTVGEQTIPIVEERLVVGKREVERGGVRVRSYVRVGSDLRRAPGDGRPSRRSGEELRPAVRIGAPAELW